MTRRAITATRIWKQNILSAIAVGAASVLLGCGGGGGNGGGGGGTLGACGSSLSSGLTVVCGYVRSVTAGTGINGAVVRLRAANGSTLYNTTSVRDSVSGQDGFFKITVSSTTPATVSVDSPIGYYSDYLKYGAATYDTSRNASAGGPCVPAVSVTTAADNILPSSLLILSTANPPPSPVFTCPR